MVTRRWSAAGRATMAKNRHQAIAGCHPSLAALQRAQAIAGATGAEATPPATAPVAQPARESTIVRDVVIGVVISVATSLILERMLRGSRGAACPQ